MASQIRILIADDHPVVRYGLKHMLASESDFEVVGEAADAEQVAKRARDLSPDIIVLDMEMGDSHGVDALRAVRQAVPGVRVIVYTAFDNADRIVEAVELGVEGYLLKDARNQELAQAIRIVHNGGTMLEPVVATKLLQHMRKVEHTTPVELTKREQQVLTLMADGKSNQAIAEGLYISERTVKFHVSSILSKLEASNRTEAVRIAARRGLIKPLDHVN